MISNKSISIFIVPFLFMLLALSVGNSQAQVVFTTNETAFNAANPGLSFQDFNDGNVGNVDTTTCGDTTLDENTDDPCFDPGDILPGIEFQSEVGFFLIGAGLFGTMNNLLCANLGGAPITINFEGTVSIVGMTLGCATEGPCDTTMDVDVLSNNNIIGETTIDVTQLNDTFLGLNSSETIDSIVLDVDTNDVTCMTIIRFGGEEERPNPIPTLSEWGLIAMAGILGIVGFMVIRRRKATA